MTLARRYVLSLQLISHTKPSDGALRSALASALPAVTGGGEGLRVPQVPDQALRSHTRYTSSRTNPTMRGGPRWGGGLAARTPSSAMGTATASSLAQTARCDHPQRLRSLSTRYVARAARLGRWRCVC